MLKLKIQDNNQQIVVPLRNTSAIKFLEQMGYQELTTAPRMVLGKTVNWKSEAVYSRASGYTG